MHDLGNSLRDYALALAALAAATLVRWLLDPVMGGQVPFLTYIVAVAYVGLFTGIVPAVLTGLASGIIAGWLFVDPRGGPELQSLEAGVALILFYVSAATIIALAVTLRHRTHRLEAAVGRIQRDMVERKRAETALRESEARMQAILDNSPLVLYIKDREGRYLLANRSYLKLFKTSAEELLGLTDYDRFPKAVADEYRANDLRVIETGEPREFEESGVFDGVTRNYVSTKFPLRDETGIYAVCGISTDISDQKRQQQELMEIDRRKDEFLSMLAHELRNPLAPIVSAVELLRLETGSPEQRRRAVQVVSRQIAHLTRLVDDLLDIARINTGRIELRLEVVDMVELARQSADNVRPRFDERGVNFLCALGDEPLWVDADASRIVQVIDNLLDNAAKYTDRGGRVELRLERERDEGVLRVRDTGVGIRPGHLPRIFEMFEQAEVSLDRSNGGLGLGLHLVKRMVESHGGRVAAYSDGPGQGSEFSVRLPLVAAQPIAPAQDARALAEAPLRVLIVEDNEDAARSMAALLEALGHEVRTAGNARAGFVTAEDFRPRLVLIDLGLPEIDGYEVARRLRARYADAVRLVALTGYGQPEYRERSRRAGFDAHLVKPASVEDIRSVLREEAGQEDG
ncbi:MAG: ATP-binding protein [Pseudomonadota bacterium]